ncbi:MAG TPA: deoxyguanosinetriphosphate triphosphohydrolase [Phycisphaerae bacterium]|nr:deoxyguanosinetriphosphate triphosphohydrolase [Phycisphaerae bacterium]
MDTCPRERYEAAQLERLAAYAVSERDCGGRAFPEKDDRCRTCFQRDRDRIIHCSAFRRLDFKTQVFVPHEQDHYRTRMTHTLEVAQIARDLGRTLALNEDLIEAVALAHDLGHPPFGHAGESALAELMAGRGGFEHNRQSLRVVDFLEHPYGQFRGLNLTRVVRECLARHETRYDQPQCAEFSDALHAPLEGQLVDLADEIAYTAADLEDALSAGWINVEQLAGLALWQQAWQQAEETSPDARPIHKRIRACKNILSAMADDLVETTATKIAAAGVDSPDAARRAKEKCVAFSPPLADAAKEMHKFLFARVYQHPRGVEKNGEAQRIISDIFEAYVGEPSLLPARYRGRIDSGPDSSRHRVACDYIAGMTDRFCREEHNRICGCSKDPRP